MIGIVITIIGIVISLFVPEVRLFLGIEGHNNKTDNQPVMKIGRVQGQQYVGIKEIGIAVATEDINGGTKLNKADANRFCNNLILGGHTNWRLPTVNELTTIFLSKNSIGGFSNEYYWSSSQMIDMKDGGIVTPYIHDKCRCRCVRTIPSISLNRQKCVNLTYNEFDKQNKNE